MFASYFAGFIREWIEHLPRFFAALMAIQLMEWFAPRERPSLETGLRSLVIALVIMTPATILFYALQGHFLPIRPMLPKSMWADHPVVTVVFLLLAYDFLYYVMHRMAHKYFWRIHATHHSIEQLSAVNHNNHPLHIILDGVIISMPLALLGVETGVFVAILIDAQGRWLHSPTRLHFGPLRWVLNDNRHHRIHHSLEERHWDKNFSLIFPLWDIVFRTAHMSEPHVWPKTGLRDQREARTLAEYFAQPFERRGP